MSPDRYRTEPPLGRAQLVIGLYGALALLAVLVSAGRGDPDPYRLDDGVTLTWLALSPVLGLLIGLAVVGLTRLVTRRYAWARTLHRDFRELLGPVGVREIIILAVASSIGEELLFRGTLLPWIGVWPQAAVFALLHVGPGRRFLPWTVSAFVLGVALGYVAVATDNLGAPIVAHFTINLLNLRYIVRVELEPRDGPALIVPGERVAGLDLNPRKR
ncbi:MAG: CPBP family intramembrane metalloprotease [Kofleriaceae bacterium]|nr:CPBP family intramembrane metalloprotease [Kofleriaceae bacterium]MCB9571413.1 CPBP family intramembrane metalloprotease [Kofleriaceae bacterium]